MFRGCSGLFRAVPGGSGGVPGMFRGVLGVFRGVPGSSGFYRHPSFVAPLLKLRANNPASYAGYKNSSFFSIVVSLIHGR